MWEILVPTTTRTGRLIRVRQHRVWDEKVRAISGGLTIMPVVKGQYVHPSSASLFSERMIPVRIICDEPQIRQIAAMTMKFYDQLAVLAYRIADRTIMLEKGR